MKQLLKSLLFSAVFAFAGISSTMENANFELWNKTIDPLYYSVSNSVQTASRRPFQELRAGKWTNPTTIDINKPTVIAVKLGKMPTAGDRVDIYSIKPGKKIIVRVGLPAEKEKFKETLKEWFGKTSIEADGYIFGPQTGPLLGLRAQEGIFPFSFENAINERGLPLKGNVTKDDITKGSMIYLPR